MLEKHLVPYAQGTFSMDFVFMQNTAAVFTGGVVKEWFAVAKISVLGWPAKSHDLNPI